jgi:hypothetical protein
VRVLVKGTVHHRDTETQRKLAFISSGGRLCSEVAIAAKLRLVYNLPCRAGVTQW